ncbi:MAG: hypothetical protein KC636_17680, partial [Myxococcales bacterium]|nr:hypothetical protein [Myxococcales bacterium]
MGAFALSGCGDDSGRTDASVGSTDTAGTGTDATTDASSSEGSDGSESTAGTSAGTDTMGSSGSDSDSDPTSDSDPSTTEPLVPFEVTPPEATVVVLNNVSQQGDYDALYDGMVVEPNWSLANPALAVIDTEGKVLGTGVNGGQTSVHATYMGSSADALLNVLLEKDVDVGPPIDPGEK